MTVARCRICKGIMEGWQREMIVCGFCWSYIRVGDDASFFQKLLGICLDEGVLYDEIPSPEYRTEIPMDRATKLAL